MRLQPIDLKQITIDDPFWSKHVDLVRREIIPYQWRAMNDQEPDAEPSHCLDNFRIAAGRTQGKFYGFVFQDTDIAKWLEAVGLSLASHPDPDLEATADEVIDLIGDAQQSDGYLDTYFIIEDPDLRWKNLCEGHELYTAGHMMEAGVAYYQGTGKRKLLDIVCRLADLICRVFGDGEGQIAGYPGHPEVEIGLIKLYQATGKKAYLDMAAYFVNKRGVGENYFLLEEKKPGYKRIFWNPDSAYDTSYSQSHLPVRLQKTAIGHAVRAVYLYCAMADLADEYKDDSLMDACKTLWNNMANRQMYITGGIGSSGTLERFTVDYDLPNDTNYSESCASIGLALFGMRMANILKDASYVDVVERALYNTVLAGIALDGRSFFYVNPLEVWPDNCIPYTSKEHIKPIRQKWFGCACCPPNIARTLAALGQFVYSVDQDGLYVNLFVSGTCKARIHGAEVEIKTETRFPYENKVKIALKGLPEGGIKLNLRVPDYASEPWVRIEGETLEITKDSINKGYLTISANKDCCLEYGFEAPARFVRANPRVHADSGKLALVKGPLVYCLEEVDNGQNLPSVYVSAGTEIREEFSDLFGGTTLLKFDGKKIRESDWDADRLYGEGPVTFDEIELTAIPYAYWNNRGMGEMLVWMKESL